MTDDPLDFQPASKTKGPPNKYFLLLALMALAILALAWH